MSKQKIWRAAWPHVTVGIIDEASGRRTVVAFGEGGVLPPQADPSDVERLAAKGALVEVEDAPKAKPETKGAPKPETKAETKAVASKPAEHEPVKPEPAKAPAKPASKTN